MPQLEKVKFVSPARIANPVRIESAALPAIAEIPAPRMSKYTEMRLPVEQLPKVRRIVEAEVEELCRGAIPLFKERFPNLELDRFVAFIKSNMHSNMFRFVRTDNAWGAANVRTTFFEPQLTVSELWVVKIKTSLRDPLAIYADFVSWGRSIKAAEFHFGSMTGIDIKPFAEAIGFDKKHVSYAKLLGD